jgi:glycosyltransferase involved in cell wall biosynthesis
VARTRVLYVHHRADLGGAPRSLAELIAHLDDRWEPHVYVPAGRSAEVFARAGARVHTGPIAMFGHSWDNPYAGARWLLLGREAARLPAHVARLEALLRRHRFPLVHLNEAQLLPAAALAKRSGARVVWHLRSSLATEGPARRRLVLGAIDRWGDAAIAIDEDVAASFALRIPVHVVFNGVTVPGDVPAPEAAKRALGLPVDRVVVGYVGHLRRIKGWEELIRAAALLRDEPVHLAFVGGGVRPPAYYATAGGRIVRALGVADDDEGEARALVAELALADRVSFLPYSERLEQIYAALDVVAFPNRGTGLGRPVLEAAAYGKPVVASGSAAGGGVLVPEATGILVPSAADTLADALRRLVKDPDLRRRLGAAGRAHVLEATSPDAGAHAVARLYETLLEADRTR